MREENNQLLVQTSGFSMWPFLKGKEKLIVKKTSPSELKPGDLVLYQQDSRLFCHRLIKRKGGFLYLRGDASFSSQEMIRERYFVGKVIQIIKGKRIINLETKGYRVINRLILLVSPLLSFLMRVYRQILKR